MSAGALYIIHIWYLDVLTCAAIYGDRVSDEPALKWTISSRREEDVSATNSKATGNLARAGVSSVY